MSAARSIDPYRKSLPVVATVQVFCKDCVHYHESWEYALGVGDDDPSTWMIRRCLAGPEKWSPQEKPDPVSGEPRQRWLIAWTVPRTKNADLNCADYSEPSTRAPWWRRWFGLGP